MNFRYARHTNQLSRLIVFYTNVVGLQKLGEFNNHDGYNGVFLGFPDKDWHLEFTESENDAIHSSDDDDLLVFYLDSKEELDQKKRQLESSGIQIETSANPYWNRHGIEIKDPDGFGLVFSVQP